MDGGGSSWFTSGIVDVRITVELLEYIDQEFRIDFTSLPGLLQNLQDLIAVILTCCDKCGDIGLERGSKVKVALTLPRLSSSGFGCHFGS